MGPNEQNIRSSSLSTSVVVVSMIEHWTKVEKEAFLKAFRNHDLKTMEQMVPPFDSGLPERIIATKRGVVYDLLASIIEEQLKP